MAPSPLPAWVRGFPGIVLRLDADGRVAASNGRLEEVIGGPVRGHRFADLLDPAASLAKWERMRAATAAQEGRDGGELTGWELVLCAGGRPVETRRFSLLGEAVAGERWLVEHPADPRLAAVRTAVEETNTALVDTQRELVRERARLAAALREVERSNRALDDFAHVISHDLRAPLRSIGYYARFLEEDAGAALAPEARDHLDRLRRQVDRMQGMIDGALQYARTGRQRAVPERVALEELVGDVVEILSPPAGVTVFPAGPLPVLRTERAPLQQVLLNLIANAVAHGGPAVRVEVSARDAGAQVEISVADDGPGVPAAMRERIWQLFHSGGAEGKGTGIGLAVVKRLVEDRGGRAWVDAAGDRGAIFRFTWPRQPM